MNPNRRELLAKGAALTALVATAGCTKIEDTQGGQVPAGGSLPYEGPEGAMRIHHIWADEDGVSHVRTVYNANLPKPIPATEVRATFVGTGTEDWHTAPGKVFVINTRGDIEGEVSDGRRQSIGQGDLVFLEDRTGKGHITRLLTDVAALFIQVADDFDFEAWLNEPAPETEATE